MMPALAVFLLLLLPVPAAAVSEIPQLRGYVNDYAEMISPAAETSLEQELSAFERSDSTQIVILTVPSLGGEAVEDFGIRVAEAWKVGQSGKDNGAILIVSKEDRTIRIEVGRGLEGRLTDLMAGRIIDGVMKPRFRSGDFDGGFALAVSSIIAAVRGEFAAEQGRSGKRAPEPPPVMTFLIFGAIALMVIGSISKILSGVAGAVGLPLAAMRFVPSLGIPLLAVLVVLGFFTGFLLPLLFSSGYRGTGGRGDSGMWRSGGPFHGGFGGGGFGSGGFGGGGGFSGGGGGFGGGGASGNW